MGDTALGQGANTGKFAAASVSASTYVFAAQGTDVRGPLQLAGLLTAGTSGTITGTLNWNDLTQYRPVAPPLYRHLHRRSHRPRHRLQNRRLNLRLSFHLYLTGDGNGLLLSNDTADIFNGQAFQQQTSPFAAASCSGMYGLNDSTYVIVRGWYPAP